MHILEDVIDRELDELNQEGVQLRHIGHLDQLPPMLREKVLKAIEINPRKRPPGVEPGLQLWRPG